MNPISILVVDDNPVFLDVLCRFLGQQEDVHVVGRAYGGKSAMDMVQELCPDVVLLDLAMNDMHGLQAIPKLRETAPGVRVVVLTLMEAEDYRQPALDAGAHAFVSKVDLFTKLIPAVRAVVGDKAPE